MSRIGVGTVLAWGVVCALLVAPRLFAAEAAQAAAAIAGTVVIDPGHGGADLGARGPNGVLEKELTLAVAKRLAKLLRAQGGFEVVLTRTSDAFVALSERTEIANRSQATLFVSIHANSAPETEIAGSETYFLSLEASDDEAMRVAMTENDVFGQEGTADEGADVVGAILGDLIRTEHLRESSALAAMIQRQLASLPGQSRGVKQAPFVVLTGVNMPAALVEIGFITNPSEAVRMGQRDRQDAIAKALAAAIREAMMQNSSARLVTEPTPAEEKP
ncbi:MAG: N-acetylmuramoyl-L-alanine amidase [Myxococcota bacterium]